MPHTEPRYEFRMFASGLAAIASTLAAQAEAREEDRGTSTYLLSRLTIETNAKIRDGRIEVKRLRARDGQLELWEPTYARQLPVTARDFATEVAAPLGLELDLPGDAQLTAQAIADICGVEPALACLEVERSRQRYMLGAELAEHVVLRVGGQTLESIAIEGTRPDGIRRRCHELGIGNRLNESYPVVLQRFVFDRV